MNSPDPSLYDRLGGGTALETAVDALYTRVLADPELAPFFRGVDLARLKEHQRATFALLLGGPNLYKGRDLRAVHAELKIRPAHFDALGDHIVAVLSGLGVDEDTIAEVLNAIETVNREICAP